MSMKKVDDFLTQAGTFYLTTVEKGKPKCRPIGFHLLTGERLYFGVGEFKAVYRQMQANPYVEICATANGKILRYYGRAVFENDYQIANQVLSSSPTLQTIYNETTGYKLGIFHLEDATAEFRNMMSIEESFHFA